MFTKLQLNVGEFSENFIRINQVWPQLQPQTWSEAILKIYTGLDHLYHWQPPKWILEAAIDRLEIQCWLKGEIVHKWMSSLSMAASKNVIEIDIL